MRSAWVSCSFRRIEFIALAYQLQSDVAQVLAVYRPVRLAFFKVHAFSTALPKLLVELHRREEDRPSQGATRWQSGGRARADQCDGCSYSAFARLLPIRQDDPRHRPLCGT